MQAVTAVTRGVCFLRVSRPATPVVYANDEQFAIGKAKILRKSDADQVRDNRFCTDCTPVDDRFCTDCTPEYTVH